MTEPELLCLETNDGSEVIRERLRNTPAQHVLLVVSKNCVGLDSLVDLKLLGRQVIALDKEVALVTRDRELKEMARSLGFRTFSSIGSGQRAKWNGSRCLESSSFSASPRYQRSAGAMSAALGSDTLRLGERILFSLLFVSMLALLGLIVVVFVPAAAVSLRPISYPVSSTISIQANPDLESLDFINLRIPARVMELGVVGNDQIATTAVRDEPDTRATGEVVFTNRRSQSTTVISNTIVSTSAGTTILFHTTEEVTLPPRVGGRSRVSIEAIDPGPSGNVTAYSINRVQGPMDRQVNVVNVAPTGGGEMSQVTYATNADKERLMGELLQRLKQEGYEALLGELGEHDVLPPESLVAFVLSETYDKFPGEATDSLGLHMRALVRGTAFDREDAELLALRMLQEEVEEGFELLPEQIEYKVGEVSESDYDGALTFDMRADGKTWVEIDEADIREGISGKSVALAGTYLERHLILEEVPLVEVSPEWWGRLPWLPFRISVQIESAGTASD